jgi:glycerol-1-phosphate dehydrogenase [NAD(P)+]
MTSERIAAALAEARDTREVRIGEGAIAHLPAVLREHFGPAPVLLVADENTHAAAGGRVAGALQGWPMLAPLVFPGRPMLHPDIECVDDVAARLVGTDAIPVAVGSGTVNDLTKLAAHRCGRPYLVVATAASMDGYTAFAAAITHQGVKRIDPCPAPRALIADLDVLRQAPPSMTSAGYGDLLAKVVAGADWTLAEALEVERMDHAAWALIGPYLRHWTRSPDRLTTGQPEAFGGLIEGLVLAGMAMQAAQSSRPASGSEHLFSHVWEMQGLTLGGAPVWHGFKVGLGTLAAAALYDWMLDQDFSTLDVERQAASWPSAEAVAIEVRAAHSDPVQAQSAVQASLAKYPDPALLVERLRRLRQVWPDLRRDLRAQVMPAEEIRSLLAGAGCPTSPEGVGTSYADLRRCYSLARQIRSRYTILDLAFEAGVLDSALQALFAPGGFWGG